MHPSWSSSSTSRLRPVLIYSGASQTQPQSFVPLECRRFSGVSCFIVGHFRNTCCPSFVCGFRVMTSRMVFPRIHWFCTDAVVLTTCGEWGHSVLCSTLLHSALKKRLRLHFWYREPLLANLVRSLSSIDRVWQLFILLNRCRWLWFESSVGLLAPCSTSQRSLSRPLLRSIRETFIAFLRFLFKETFPLGKEVQFGGVLERLILFHRPVLLGFCLRVPGAVFVGFTGSWDYAVLARWLHVFLEYLEIDTIAFLSAPGRTAVGWMAMASRRFAVAASGQLEALQSKWSARTQGDMWVNQPSAGTHWLNVGARKRHAPPGPTG